jgi:DNA-binding response OmpR family regulator
MNTPIEPSLPWSEKLIKFTPPSPLSSPVNQETGLVSLTKTRILVAEDDRISRELICTRLGKWGYEVVMAHDGLDAMTALRKKGAPSLAILDWMMPGMDGLEICRRIREVNPAVYIILLTARGSKENIVEGLGAGADDYLIKPFDKGELQARILVGLRIIGLQANLTDRMMKLEEEAADTRERKTHFLI